MAVLIKGILNGHERVLADPILAWGLHNHGPRLRDQVIASLLKLKQVSSLSCKRLFGNLCA